MSDSDLENKQTPEQGAPQNQVPPQSEGQVPPQNGGYNGQVPPQNGGYYGQVPPQGNGYYGQVPPQNNGYYGQVPPQNGGYYGQQPQQQSLSTLSIIGFIFAFLFTLVGLIISIVAYNNAKTEGDVRSQNFAKAGIIVSVVFMALGILLTVIVVIAALNAQLY